MWISLFVLLLSSVMPPRSCYRRAAGYPGRDSVVPQLCPQYLSCMSVWLDIIFFDVKASCSLAVRAMRAFLPWSQNVLWLRMMFVLWWRLFRACTWADQDPRFDGFSWSRFTGRSLASSYHGHCHSTCTYHRHSSGRTTWTRLTIVHARSIVHACTIDIVHGCVVAVAHELLAPQYMHALWASYMKVIWPQYMHAPSA